MDLMDRLESFFDPTENNIPDILKKFFNSPYYSCSEFNSYIVDKEILKYLISWCLNRKLINAHWINIYKSYKEIV